jgi:hypothetical protein
MSHGWRLNWEVAQQIRQKDAEGIPQASIAREYGIT